MSLCQKKWNAIKTQKEPEISEWKKEWNVIQYSKFSSGLCEDYNCKENGIFFYDNHKRVNRNGHYCMSLFKSDQKAREQRFALFCNILLSHYS